MGAGGADTWQQGEGVIGIVGIDKMAVVVVSVLARVGTKSEVASRASSNLGCDVTQTGGTGNLQYPAVHRRNAAT